MADARFAVSFVKVFVESVIKDFQTKSEQKINDQIHRDLKLFDRCTILMELDKNIPNMSDPEIFNYMESPLDTLNRKFYKQWAKSMAPIEYDQKARSMAAIEFDQWAKSMNFFDVLQLIQNHLKVEQDADKATFISELFEPRDVSDYGSIANKGQCVSLLLYAYFCQQNPLTRQFRVSNVTYLLRDNGEKLIKKFPRPNDDTKTVLSTMSGNFKLMSILNLFDFIQKCLEQKPTAIQDFGVKLSDSINLLNNVCSTQRAILLSKHCDTQCPCCTRIFDVDHKIDARFAPGTGENLHRCQSGHQYRAFGKIKSSYKNLENGFFEASVIPCEHIKENMKIGIGIWSEYKRTHPDWDWDFITKPMLRPINEISDYRASVWNRIGKQWCGKYEMDFVIENTDMKLKHYIFLLDNSGSMKKTDRWTHLIQAIRTFTKIHNELKGDGVASFVLFGLSAKSPPGLLFKEIKLLNESDFNLLQNSTPEGGTNFQVAFQKVIEILKSINSNDKVSKRPQVIIFMTDGEAGYPQQELVTLSTTYRSVIKEFWTVACETSSLTELRKINQVMKGSFKDVQQADGLVQVYSELASNH
ncbi:unnamed protein product [Rotaria socialis]|uniref:VWFA domain-containing protein n=2 Tax=Rotaria socialis TaxID=392032 RepID=A0A820Y9Y5_9BILA|nr:unnamed protein product [Rotaria socialis]